MEPNERRCENCWCRRRGSNGQPGCSLPTMTLPDGGCAIAPDDWCCPEHRNADEQAMLWRARNADTRSSAHELDKIVYGAEMVACGEERRATVAWLRSLKAAVFVDPPGVIADLADRIEAGEHRKEQP